MEKSQRSNLTSNQYNKTFTESDLILLLQRGTRQLWLTVGKRAGNLSVIFRNEKLMISPLVELYGQLDR